MSFKVTIVGVGGLGAPALLGLIRRWKSETVLDLTLIDGDCVELSNLNRQILFSTSSVGKPKASVAIGFGREFARKLGAKVELEAIDRRLEPSDYSEVLSGTDFLIDGTDDIQSKFSLNDFAVKHEIAFCHAGVTGFKGNVLTMIPSDGYCPGCLRCLFPDVEATSDNTATCQQGGIVGAFAGIAGDLQAQSAVDYFNGRFAHQRTSVLQTIGLRDPMISRSEFAPIVDCPNDHGLDDFQDLDLREQVCPATFLYTKIALEKLSSKKFLNVWLADPDSVSSVSRSIFEEGYQVIGDPLKSRSGYWSLLIRNKMVG